MSQTGERALGATYGCQKDDFRGVRYKESIESFVISNTSKTVPPVSNFAIIERGADPKLKAKQLPLGVWTDPNTVQQ
jgi:hypothetical protein